MTPISALGVGLKELVMGKAWFELVGGIVFYLVLETCLI